MTHRALALIALVTALAFMDSASSAQVAPSGVRVVRGRVVLEGAAARPTPPPAPAPRTTRDTLPAQLTDAEFWRMISEFSEPGGTYPYENFVSNERRQQIVIPALKQAVRPGEVYIGVAPEQNFTYAAAVQAKMAFVLDIRRQNMLEHLLYKALFELSPNRADFVSRLFSRKRPAGLDEKTSASALFAAYEAVRNDADFFMQNVEAVKGVFRRHGFALSSDDLQKVEYVYQVFYRGGPTMNYTFASATPGTDMPSYTQIMNLSDATGRTWSYLANEENFQYVKEMQRKNLFVPLVGDFSGPKTIRSIGQYLKQRNANVSAFYASNVESYLDARQTQNFYASLLSLPTDATTMVIRFVDLNHNMFLPSWARGGQYIQVVSPMSDLVGLAKPGLLPGYHDLLPLVKDPAPGALPRFVLPMSLGPGRPFLSLAIDPQTNGTFQVQLPAAQIQAGAPSGLPAGFAIKSMTYGSKDLLRESFIVTPSDTAELVIVLGVGN
jgi:hypothetical protein